MKRSEMLLNIASELVHEYTNFMRFDKAQELAEIVLSRIEKDGMAPPLYSKYNTCICSMRGSCLICNPNEYSHYNQWEPEELFSIDSKEYEKWKKNE